MKKLLVLLVFATLFVSCSSGWSCKKRYVTTPKTYDYNKHHVIKNFDNYIVKKYNVKNKS
jgi:hypothetical protein